MNNTEFMAETYKLLSPEVKNGLVNFSRHLCQEKLLLLNKESIIMYHINQELLNNRIVKMINTLTRIRHPLNTKIHPIITREKNKICSC